MVKHPSYNNVYITTLPVALHEGNTIPTKVTAGTLQDAVYANPNRIIYVYADQDGVIEHVDTTGTRDYFCYVRIAVADNDHKPYFFRDEEIKLNYQYLLLA